MNIDQFITKSKEVHGDRYDYSQAIFTGVTHGLTLACEAHGNFNITPNAHLNYSKGCPICGDEPLEEFDDELVYIVHTDTFDEIFNKEPLVLED